jgi:hypothetical protein
MIPVCLQHHEIMDVDQRLGVEGRKPQEADRQPDIGIFDLGQQHDGRREGFQIRKQDFAIPAHPALCEIPANLWHMHSTNLESQRGVLRRHSSPQRFG